VSKLIIALLGVVLIGAAAVAIWIFVNFGQPFGKSLIPAPGDQSLIKVKNSRALQICTDASQLPWASYDPASQNYTGGEIEIGKLLAKDIGVTPRFTNRGFNSILGSLTDRDCDLVVSAMTNSVSSSSELAYSIPYMSSGQAILIRKSDESKIRGLSDLSGKTIGVEAGSDGSDVVKTIPGVKQVKSYGYDANVTFYSDLQHGLIDAVVYDELNNSWYARNHASQVSCLCGSRQLLNHSNYVVVVRDDDHALLGAVNAAIQEFTQAGSSNDYAVYKRIIANWYGG
jgi:polar amino acid transport system substrate-binding protein